MVWEKAVKSFTRTVDNWPFANDASNSSRFDLTNWCDLYKTAANTNRGVFVGTAILLARKIPSNQPVWISLALKASVSSNSTKYSTGFLILPRISTDFKANTKCLRAISRVAPDAKICPNCESANSWMPPFAPTEK